MPDLLIAGTRWLGRAHRHLAECASTSDEAAAWARAGAPHGALVTADAQTGGRGRLGRAWFSPPAENLYFSVVLRPPIPPHRAPSFTLAAAVALAEAAEATLGPRADVTLKWPNDLLVDGKKAAGILTEMVTSGARIEHVVCGIGVNLNSVSFPSELVERATSLRLTLGAEIDRARFASSLAASLERWYERWLAEGPAAVLPAWKARAALLGKPVVVTNAGGEVRGIAEDLDDDGTLLVRRDDGSIERVVAGEVAPR